MSEAMTCKCGCAITLREWKLGGLCSHCRPIKKDYEPEQAYGTADDFLKHKQYGGTRNDY